MSLNIAMDVEGVLADIHTLFLNKYNEQHGTKLTKEDIDTYTEFPRKFNMTMEEWLGQTDVMWDKKWDSIPTIEQRIEEKMAMLNERHNVDIVTARVAIMGVKKWLKKHRIQYGKLIYSAKKGALDYDIYVDDSPLLYLELFSNKHQLLYSQPWNRSLDVSRIRNVTRVDSFDEIVEKLYSPDFLKFCV